MMMVVVKVGDCHDNKKRAKSNQKAIKMEKWKKEFLEYFQENEYLE